MVPVKLCPFCTGGDDASSGRGASPGEGAGRSGEAGERNRRMCGVCGHLDSGVWGMGCEGTIGAWK